MIRSLAVILVFAALSQCDREVPPGHAWRASDVNGDKPGIGYELRNDNGKIAGDAYILDVNYPHDFSHGKRAEMKVMEQSTGQVTFRVKWNRDLSAVLRFEIKSAAWPDSFQATVSEIIDGGAYDTETFNFSKVR